MSKQLKDYFSATYLAATLDPNELLLDYRQLARFGVPDHRVPAQAILRGRPVTLYESYAPWFWAGGVIIALLSALSLLLGVNVIRRRHAERTVRARERQLQRVLDASPIGVAIVERARVVYLNAHFTRTFGYDLDIVPTMEAWWAVSLPVNDTVTFSSTNASVALTPSCSARCFFSSWRLMPSPSL